MHEHIDKSLVRMHFNRSAEHYERVTPVQARMAADLLATLPPTGTRIVEIGCGSGRLTSGLAALYPDAAIIAVDLSPVMLAVARRRVRDPRVSFVEADGEHWPLPPDVDLVVSNATVQWFHDAPATVHRWHAALRSGGTLHLTTFGPGTFRELRQAFAEAERDLGLPRREHLVDLPGVETWRERLPAAWVASERLACSYPDAHSLLRRVRDSGASLARRGTRPLRRDLYRRLLECYPPHAEGVVATYEAIRIAW